MEAAEMEAIAGEVEEVTAADIEAQMGNMELNDPQLVPLVRQLVQNISYRSEFEGVVMEICGIGGKIAM